jgi:hypothetical protein
LSSLNKKIGKYVSINPDNPSSVGVCDYSGFVFNHEDLVKQMEWKGDKLVWTGLMVGRPYLDKPNEQDRPPLVKDDPRPIKNPRLPTPYTNPDSNPVPPNNILVARLNATHWGN